MRTKLLILLVFLIAFPVYSYYEPLSREKADNYLQSITYDKVLDIVIDYDYIDNTIPTVEFPDSNYALIGEDLVATPMGHLYITISDFKWKIPMKQSVQYGFYTKPNSDYKIWLGLSIGVVAGFGLGFLIGGF